MKAYNHERIEKKWQTTWQKKKLYATQDAVKGKKNYYQLVEFPYPSGNLHVGHWYAFAVPDILARLERMRGKNVLYPIGFDAFGLPAENAAIKRGINPRTWTYKNIAHMRKQIASMGTMFDHAREVVTCDPAYYKWTQWQFIQMYKKGLIHRKPTQANWCSSCKTVLANEQVVGGACERCGTIVEQREMPQWNVAITKYADRLVDDLDKLDWPEAIKDSQRNWIGRSMGAEIIFEVVRNDKKIGDSITVFTTRPDTLFGATFVVIAPEHKIVKEWLNNKGIKNKKSVESYIEKSSRKTDLERQENREKTGVLLEGISALNPATNKTVPVFIADYVLAKYGTGAIMAVPAHDERDAAFADAFLLPKTHVVTRIIKKTKGADAYREGAPVVPRRAVMAIVKNSKNEYLVQTWNGHDVRTFISGGIESGESIENAAVREVTEESGYADLKVEQIIPGVRTVEFYHLQKEENRRVEMHYVLLTLKSERQELVASEEAKKHTCEWKQFSELKNYLTLGETESLLERMTSLKEVCYEGDGYVCNSGPFSGLSIEEAKDAITKAYGVKKTRYRLRDWIVSRQRYWGVPIPMIYCSSCEKKNGNGFYPVPEKELPVVLPRVTNYLPSGTGKSPLDKAIRWKKVRCPSCGAMAERETDTLDTFVDSSWYFNRYTDATNKKEFASPKKLSDWMPVDLYSGGAEHTTMHVLYSRFWQKVLFDLKLVKDKEPYIRRMNRGLILGPDGQKMSKSKGNVIDPDDVVSRLGADTLRLYLAFIGPYNEPGSYPWSQEGIAGSRRFVERVWRLRAKIEAKNNDQTERALHKTIKKVTENSLELKFNAAIAQLMTLMNIFDKSGLTEKQYETFLKLLAPFAPHISEELWSDRGHKKSIHIEQWPTWSKEKVIDQEVTIAVQVNGKVRGTITIELGENEEQVIARAQEITAQWLTGKRLIKAVYIPNRIVNLVMEG